MNCSGSASTMLKKQELTDAEETEMTIKLISSYQGVKKKLTFTAFDYDYLKQEEKTS